MADQWHAVEARACAQGMESKANGEGRSCESRTSHRPMMRQSVGMRKSPIMTRLPTQRLVQNCDLDHFAVICGSCNWRSPSQHCHSKDLPSNQEGSPSPHQTNSNRQAALAVVFLELVATRKKVQLCTDCQKRVVE